MQCFLTGPYILFHRIIVIILAIKQADWSRRGASDT